MRNERILFLYASPNSGHKECADAVRNAFKSLHPSTVKTTGVDTIHSLFPVLGPLVAKTYLEILRYTPQIWDFLYDNPDIEEITRELRQIFSLFNSSKLKSVLTSYHPTALVCTHAIPCGLIAEQKRRGKCNLPLIAVTTDYAVHSYWIYPEVDLYIVANQESQKTLAARGIAKEKIKVIGIPVDASFNKEMEKEDARKKLGLDPHKPTVLIMGGSRGFGPISEIIKEIVALRPAPQFLVLTGTNKELEKELSVYKSIKNFHIFGYTRSVPVLMAASDILITKPGGITSSEALVKGLPMILVDPIPGQEERNARYLLKHNAAIQVRKIGEIKEWTKQLLHHSEKLRQMSENSKKISHPNSATNTIQEILSLVNGSEEKSRPMHLPERAAEPDAEKVPLLSGAPFSS